MDRNTSAATNRIITILVVQRHSAEQQHPQQAHCPLSPPSEGSNPGGKGSDLQMTNRMHKQSHPHDSFCTRRILRVAPSLPVCGPPRRRRRTASFARCPSTNGSPPCIYHLPQHARYYSIGPQHERPSQPLPMPLQTTTTCPYIDASTPQYNMDITTPSPVPSGSGGDATRDL